MVLRLVITKKLSAKSERVKSVDFHPQEPWILSALYSGHIFLWNYASQTLVKSLEVCDLPVRCAKFIAKKNWIVCGADDMQIRIYNYNTMERIKQFEAHTDYIRSIAIHPTLPYMLTTSDDMLIKLWDWEKNWECIQTFEGHTHYVMQVEFNPKDSNTFASASLDRSVKVWGLNSPAPHFSLEGHERGVNCISYYRGGDKPYLLSGADDQLVKVWDYQTKTCISTLEGHSNNVSAVSFHPSLPIILSGSEDGSLRIWHVNTYKLENTLNYGMERVWSISTLKGSNKVAVGYDEGTVSLKLGHEEPVASMHQGKIVWAQNNEMVFANMKQSNAECADGERVAVSTKEMGTCEVFPQSVSHSPNGRLLVACGDGEYIIYTALALKNHSFGTGLEFVWANDQGGGYAVRESSTKIKVFKASKDKGFVEHKSFRPSYSAEGIFGGALLAVRSADFIEFYDWNECRVIRRIDVCPKKVFWAESGEVVVLACEASFYVLRYNRDFVKKIFDKGIEIAEIENAFDLEQEVPEKVRSGCFIGECFVYTNTAGRLNYYVGGEIMTLAHLTKTMYLLGFVTNANRLFLMDKQKQIYTYQLLVSMLVYQTAIVRQDFKSAESYLDDVPVEQYNKIARFLENYGLKEMALAVTNDPEHKFELAMSCHQLELARDIVVESESEQKWKQLGDAALNQDFNLKLAEECFVRSKDLGSLLLLYTSLSDEKRIAFLAKLAREQGRNNIAFICLFLLNRVEDCIKLLCETDRIPEAAFLARTYAPSKISEVLQLWKENLKHISPKAAEALADPKEYEELFPDLEAALKIEAWLKTQTRTGSGEPMLRSASDYNDVKGDFARDLISEVREGALVLDEDLDFKEEASEFEQPVEAKQSTPAPLVVPATRPVEAAPSPVEAKPPAGAAEPAKSPVAEPVIAKPTELTKDLSSPLAKPEPVKAPASPLPVVQPVAVPVAAPVAEPVVPEPVATSPSPKPAELSTPELSEAELDAQAFLQDSPKAPAAVSIPAAVPAAAVIPVAAAVTPAAAPVTPVAAPVTPVATSTLDAEPEVVPAQPTPTAEPAEQKKPALPAMDELDPKEVDDIDAQLATMSIADMNSSLAELDAIGDWTNDL